jgi:hypothetical protein
MPVEQHDKNYGERTIYRVLIVMGALMGFGVLMLAGVKDSPPVTTTGWVLISIWSAILIIGTVWACRVQTRYRCPKCGARLPMLRPEASTKYEHQFHCSACDVIWTTNVHVGDG